MNIENPGGGGSTAVAATDIANTTGCIVSVNGDYTFKLIWNQVKAIGLGNNVSLIPTTGTVKISLTSKGSDA